MTDNGRLALLLVVAVVTLIAGYLLGYLLNRSSTNNPSPNPASPACTKTYNQLSGALVGRAFSTNWLGTGLRIPEIAAKWPMKPTETLVSVAVNWLMVQTQSTGQYNLRAMQNLVLSVDSSNWWNNEIGIPKTIAYCIALTGFKRDDQVAELLALYVQRYPNPFVRGGQLASSDDNAYAISLTPDGGADGAQLFAESYDDHGFKLVRSDDGASVTVEENLDDAPDDRSTTDTYAIAETYTNLYHKVSYFVVLQAYQKLHNVKLAAVNDTVAKGIDQLLASRLQTKQLGNTLPGQKSIPDGFYRTNEEPANQAPSNDEVGFIYHGSVPYGLGYLAAMLEPIFFTDLALVNGGATPPLQISPLIRDLCDRSYARLYNALRAPYAQSRGCGRGITRIRLRAQLFSALVYLRQIDPARYSWPIDRYAMQLRALNSGQQTIYPFVDPASVACPVRGKTTASSTAVAWDDTYVVRSRAEGFTIATRGSFVYEQACYATYLIDEYGKPENDDLQANGSLLRGYLNYGCDFAPLLRDVNQAGQILTPSLPSFENPQGYMLPGQFVPVWPKETNNVTLLKNYAIPRTCVLVALDAQTNVNPTTRTLFYQAHHHDTTYRAHGLLDLQTGVHRTYLRAAPQVSMTDPSKSVYCPFAWFSEDQVAIRRPTNKEIDAKVDWLIVQSNILTVTLRLRDVNTDSSDTSLPRFLETVRLLNGYGCWCTIAVPITHDDRIYAIDAWFDWDRAHEYPDGMSIAQMNQRTKRLDGYTLRWGLDDDLSSDASISPTAFSIVERTSNKVRWVIDDSFTYDDRNAATGITRRRDDKRFPFSDQNLGRVAFIEA